MRRATGMRIWGVIAGGVLAAGCLATTRQVARSKPIVDFPAQQALSALGATPPPEPPRLDTGEVPAEGWTVEATDAARALDEVWQPQSDWEQAFAALAAEAARPPRLTRALACLAHEVGRYHLDHKAAPPDELQHFMAAACGSFVPEVGFSWLSGSAPHTASDGSLLASWRAQIKPDLLGHVPAEASEVGFWFGRAHGRAMALMAFAVPRARLTPAPLQPDAAGNLTIEGQLTEAADYVEGYVNQGRFGVAPCTIDPAVARPRFRAICRLAPDDATAWVQLFFAPPRRVLAIPFVQVLARRSTEEPLLYRPESYGTERPVGSAAEFSSAVVEQLNAVRSQAALPPVSLSAGESATAAKLAGHYFSATLATRRRYEDADRIALGLLAGWDVGGMIRDGHFASSVIGNTRDAGRWLTATLAMPLGRTALLAPDIETIALGPLLLSEPEGLGAIVTGYRFHHGNDHGQDVARLYAHLAEARKRAGQEPARRLSAIDKDMRLELQRVNAGQIQPSQAMNELLSDASGRYGKSMRAYLIEATSLEAFELPPAVARQRHLDVEIGVTHHRPDGAAWAQLVILVVYVDYEAGLYQEI